MNKELIRKALLDFQTSAVALSRIFADVEEDCNTYIDEYPANWQSFDEEALHIRDFVEATLRKLEETNEVITRASSAVTYDVEFEERNFSVTFHTDENIGCTDSWVFEDGEAIEDLELCDRITEFVQGELFKKNVHV